MQFSSNYESIYLQSNPSNHLFRIHHFIIKGLPVCQRKLWLSPTAWINCIDRLILKKWHKFGGNLWLHLISDIFQAI